MPGGREGSRDEKFSERLYFPGRRGKAFVGKEGPTEGERQVLVFPQALKFVRGKGGKPPEGGSGYPAPVGLAKWATLPRRKMGKGRRK